MIAPTAVEAEVAAPAPAPEDQRRSPWGAGIEALFLLVAPIGVFYLLAVRAMAPFDMIDAGFSTGLAQHGRDLILRYGIPNSDYFWVRVAFIFPAHLAYVAFGPIGGFYVFRYVLALLATVPTYLLFRRLRGPGAAALAALVVLTSPVILLAWGTDYADSAAVSYLIAGMTCLVMPARSPARRRAWLVAGGVLLALAPLAHFASAPLVLAAVGGYLLVQIKRPIRASAVDAGLLAGAALVTFGALSVMAHLYFGHGNLISPTLRAARMLRTPAQLKNWHSSNWRWALYVPYVLVPPAILGAWAVARARRWRQLAREELTIAVVFGLQVLAYYGLQFGGGQEQTLEFHLFSSMLWSGAMLTLAFLLTAIGAPLLVRAKTLLVPALLVVGVPFVYRFWRPNITLHFSTGLVLAAVTVALAVPAFLGLRDRALAAIAATGVVTMLLALTVAVGPPHAPLPGTTLLPTGKYRAMFGESGRTDLDTYRVASELVKVIPPASHAGEDLLLWWPSGQFLTVNEPAAEYLWHINSLQEDLPQLSDGDVQLLNERRPATLVLLSETGREFGTALSSLVQGGYRPSLVREGHLHAGAVHLSVDVVQLDRFTGR